MDNINILEELGLQEVSRRTHIEVKFLQYMINKDFDKLNRINTLGFAKILKREYEIDLSSWLEEFEAYWKENRQEGAADNSTANLIAQENSNKKRSKIWILLLLILLLIAGAIWYLNQSKYFSEPQTQEVQLSQIQPKEPQKNELEEPIENVDDVKIIDINSSEDANQVANIDKSENNTTTLDTNESNQTETIVKEEAKTVNEAYIQPKKRIWVGIVDLESRKKSQYTTSKPITINLNKPQIIITGHASFDLIYEDGKEEPLTDRRTMYYYVDGGTITNINKKEFISYNGGKSW